MYSTMYVLNIYPEERIGDPAGTSDVREAEMDDEHSEERYQDIKSNCAEPSVGLKGCDKPITIKIKEINMLLKNLIICQ